MLSLVLFIKEAKSGHIHFKISFFKYSDLHTFSSQEHLYNSIHSDYDYGIDLGNKRTL